MRVVADTNTVVSGLLWHGSSRQVLDKSRTGEIELFSSIVLLAELEEVLERDKFARRLAIVGLRPRDLVVGYAALATVVEPPVIPHVIVEDPDDDAVLACAVVARADAIVSGDTHLLSLRAYREIPILTAGELLNRI